MESLRPHVQVVGPDGQEFTVELQNDRLTIGRLPDRNDVALAPDPDRLVSREAHCALEREGSTWWVLDRGSVNGSRLRRDQREVTLRDRTALVDGDILLIPGQRLENGDLRYWELRFADPLETQPAAVTSADPCLAYDWPRARLFLFDGVQRTAIALRPQAHKLVRYMVQRNTMEAGHSGTHDAINDDERGVLCTHEELMVAVWGEEAPYHTRDELIHLVREVRKLVEVDPDEPRFLQTVRGLGYRLETCQ